MQRHWVQRVTDVHEEILSRQSLELAGLGCEIHTHSHSCAHKFQIAYSKLQKVGTAVSPYPKRVTKGNPSSNHP